MNKPNWALDPIIKLTRYEALEILKHREGFCDLTMSTVKNRMDFIVRNISVDFVKIINTLMDDYEDKDEYKLPKEGEKDVAI